VEEPVAPAVDPTHSPEPTAEPVEAPPVEAPTPREALAPGANLTPDQIQAIASAILAASNGGGASDARQPSPLKPSGVKAGDRCWFRIAPDGMVYAGIPVERGRVIALHGANDDKLVRLGYLVPLKTSDRTVRCGRCDAEFTAEMFLRAHGDAQHGERRELSPEEEDRRLQAADAKITSETPPFWENTLASQGIES
jgi:hypothetical protein